MRQRWPRAAALRSPVGIHLSRENRNGFPLAAVPARRIASRRFAGAGDADVPPGLVT